MRTSNASFDTELAKSYKEPIIYAVFFDVSGTQIVERFTSRKTSLFVDDAAKTYYENVVNINVVTPEIDEISPSLGESQVTITLNETYGLSTITQWLRDENIIGGTVEIYLGFAPLADSDFILLQRSRVRRFRMASETIWEIIAVGDVTNLRGTIYPNIPQNILKDDEGEFNGTFDVIYNTTQGEWIDPATANLPSGVEVGLKIDGYVKVYSTLNTFSFTGINRYLKDPTSGGAVTHPNGTFVTQAIVFNRNPLEVLLHILTSTVDGTNGEFDLGIEVFEKPFGLAIDESKVNVAAIKSLGYKLFDIHQGSALAPFIFSERVDNALNWIEDNILAPYALFLFVDSNDKINVGNIDWLRYTDDFASLSAGSIDDTTTIPVDDLNFEDVDLRNNFVFNFQSQIVSKTTDNQFDYSYDQSSGFYGDSNEKNVDYNFLARSEFIVSTTPRSAGEMEVYIQRWFEFQSKVFTHMFEPPARVRIRSFLSNILFEQGDFIEYSNSTLRNIVSGFRGWTNEKGLIVGQTFDFRSGLHELEIVFHSVMQKALPSGGLIIRTPVNEASITRKTATLNADDSATINAEDAYHTYASPDFGHFLIVTVRITSPGTAGTTLEFLNLQVIVIDTVGVTVAKTTKENVSYNPQSGTSEEIEIRLHTHTGFLQPTAAVNYLSIETVKLDYTFTTAVVSDEATVEMIKLEPFSYINI